jgi:hypothetical protein
MGEIYIPYADAAGMLLLINGKFCISVNFLIMVNIYEKVHI